MWNFSLAPAHGDLHHWGSRGRLPPRSKQLWFPASPFPLLFPASTRLLLFTPVAFHEASLVRPASFSETPDTSLQRDPPPMTCTTQGGRGGPRSPPPSSSFLSFQTFAAFLLHLFHSGSSTKCAFSAQAPRPLSTSFIPAPSSPQISVRTIILLLFSAT